MGKSRSGAHDKARMPRANQEKLEMLGELISSVTHEINTPMHFIGHNLTFLKLAFQNLLALGAHRQQMLKNVKIGAAISDDDWRKLAGLEEGAEPEYLEHEVVSALDQSVEGVEMVSRLVLALKDFTHPSTHEFSLTDVNKCVATISTISRNVWKRVAELRLDLARDLPFLYCSQDELHQVLLNLVVNAAHAIEEKIAAGQYDQGLITIVTKAQGEAVEIEVRNDGPQIALDLQKEIFKPYFTTKEPGKGTGLGLSIVRRIVEEAHGGQIFLTSDSDKGTSFRVVLPHRSNDGEV